ncbi:MAG: polyprenyl diphosphate synthase [Candidatus Bipolaricaulota bacterium]
MDGNGRWAKVQGLPRGEGHRRGAEAAERLIRLAGEEKLCRHLTLFAFSTENWDRPPEEVDLLIGLLEEFIAQKVEELSEAGVRLDVVGQRELFPASLSAEVARVEELTRDNQGLQLHVALSFGGRWAVMEAVRGAVRAARENCLQAEAVDEPFVRRLLPTANLPDVDLVIRTAGEQRLSNFLLWETAYAELYFTPVLWPDFDEAAFLDALETYQGRQRSFGRVSS